MLTQKSSTTLRIAGIMGLLGVALGAFGAHMLKVKLGALGTTGIWEKAVLYHLIHAVALLAVGLSTRAISRWIPLLFTAGIILFSGSLYALALSKLSFLGPITPLGGVCFIAGWAMLVIKKHD